jgi:hypothetical protein
VLYELSSYLTTHTSRSGLQFIFHNSYITLRLAVYISQLIHDAQACSLYFTTHTLPSLSVMYELWNINCKPERDVWVVKYKLQACACYMSCEIKTVSLSVMCELWNISQLIHHAQACSLYFTTHTSHSILQFVFHNSYITLRLTVYISQLKHYTQAYSLYLTTHTSMSCEIQTVSLSVMCELWNIYCKPDRDVWVVKYKLQGWA